MNLAAWLARAARSEPLRPAVFRGAALWADYGSLAGRVARAAAGLRARGLAPGDRVAIVMKNAPEYLEALYAIWWAGLAAVPINAKLHGREVEFVVSDSGARLTLDDPAHVARLAGSETMAPAEVPATSLAWLFYTSGTTGRPKGAMLSMRNLAQMTFSYFCDVDDVPRDGRLLHAAPLSHGSGLYNFTHLARGAAQVVPESGGFDPAEVGELLRTLVYGGGPMYHADLVEAMALLGNRLAQIYGQGESPMTITALSKHHHGEAGHPRHLERITSVGIPHSVVEVTIRDADGRVLPAGEAGEICVRGDVVMSGYWNNPSATAEEIIEHCRARIASYKKPKTVEFVDALPRTKDYAKDYDALDARFGGGGYPGGDTLGAGR
jgi:long-chain acyl-CoA synthetase